MLWRIALGCNLFAKNKLNLIVLNGSKPKLLNSVKSLIKKPIKIHQGSLGKLISNKSNLLIFSGLGIRLSLSAIKIDEKDKFQPAVVSHSQRFDWALLTAYLLEDIWLLVGAIMASLLAAFFNTLIPVSLGSVVNAVSGMLKGGLQSEVYHNLKNSSLSIIGLYICQSLSTFLYISMLAVVGERLATRIKYDLFTSIISQDIEFFDKQRTGELVDCLTTDVQEFKSSFKLCVSQGLRSVTQIAGCLGSLIIISPLMTGVMLVVIPTAIAGGSLIGSILRRISKRAQEEAVKATTICEEIISNIRTVKAFANENEESSKYLSQVEQASNLYIILGYGIGIFQAGTNLFLNILVLGTLYIGSHLISSNKLSPGDLMSFLVATQTIQKSFAQLSLMFGHFVKGKQAGTKIFHFINLKPVIQNSGGIKISRNALIPHVEFKNVSFAYPTRPSQTILKNLNLSLPAGKTVAIVGSSGNGKSTIVALLERFYDVDSGSITFGGIDLRNLNVSWLRGSAIGLINQEPTLFANTIMENIKYGRPDASEEEVYSAARLANADEFIREFPEGYNTVLGERGVTVSGGQKQRIALARVLLKDPVLLILDEATSALDTESEKIVQTALEKVSRGRTVLVIAHRLSTVQNADVIIVLQNGQVAEIGDHKTLLSKKGHYYNLMMQQNE